MADSLAANREALSQLTRLLTQLKPPLETRLVVLSQEHEHGLIPAVSLKLAQQRLHYLNWVLGKSPALESALRLCASLTIDLKALADVDEGLRDLERQFLELYFRQGYKLINNVLQLPEGEDLSPDFYTDPKDFSP